MRFVLDASLALAWCFEDETTPFTTAVLEALPALGAAVPTLWIYEVTNGLRTAQKHERITADTARGVVGRLDLLPIDSVVLDAETMLGEVRLMALEHDLSAYDASYLSLAKNPRVPIGTLDGTGKRAGLKHAAKELDVPLLHISHLELSARDQNQGTK